MQLSPTGVRGAVRLLWRTALFLVAAAAIPLDAAAESPAAAKREYNLFSPVPPESMRELAAERPGVTNSPITLDAGHFQLDTEMIGYEFEDRGEDTERTYAVLETTLGIGLSRRTSAQLVLTPYSYEKTGASAKSGFGDLTIRLKGNLWGNDPEPGQSTAFAILSEITIPTGTEISTAKVEGSVLGTFVWKLSDRAALGSQLQVEFLYDADRRRYDTDWVHTLIASTAALAPFGLQVEYVGKAVVSGGRGYRPALGAGVTYSIGANVQLDVDVRVGLGSSQDFDSRRAKTGRVRASTGITVRF